MPPPEVQTLRALLYWQYAKILSSSAGMGKRQWNFVMDRFLKLRDRGIAWDSIHEYVRKGEDSEHCIYCGRTEGLQPDYLIPTTFHGPEDKRNSTCACGSCRTSKGKRRVYEYWASQGGLDAAKYDVPRIAECKYLALLHDLFERAGLLDVGHDELRRRSCPVCDLVPLCRREGSGGKLTPLCLDGVATLVLAGGLAARPLPRAQTPYSKDASARGGPRWRDENRDGICDLCEAPIDSCRCVCPYCGESKACECAIGSGIATGG